MGLILNAAHFYHEQRFSTLAVTKNKRPYAPWTAYQERWKAEGQTLADVEHLFRDDPWGVALLLHPYSSLVVLDCDGPHALDLWRETEIILPATATNFSPSGGPHLYFTRPPGCDTLRRTVRIVQEHTPCGAKPGGCGVDLLCNGFAICPPTPGYREDPDHPFGTFAELPPAVLALMRQIERQHTAQGDGALQGTARNVRLTSLAGSLRKGGSDETEIRVAIGAINAHRYNPPLPAEEISRIANSMTRYPTGGAAAETDGHPGNAEPEIVRLVAVQPEKIEWLWAGRIPRGKFALLVGDPGLGKSTLCIDVMARVTTGAPWPDGAHARQGNVVLLTAEDGLADTVRPRLDAAGGDASRVWVLRSMKEGRMFNLVTDVAALESLVRKHDACLVVIDPVAAYLGKVDTFRDSEIRGALAPLAGMAERTGATVLGVMHLTKEQQKQIIHRTQGNVAFVASARLVLGVVEDRDAPGRILYMTVKMNLAGRPPDLAYRLREAPNGSVRLEWDEAPVDVDLTTAFSPPVIEEKGERQRAEEFLQEQLAAGPVPTATVEADAKKADISTRTLDRARVRLGIKSRRESFRGGWTLRLPEDATP